MRVLIDWVRSNVIADIAIIVVVLSSAGLVYIVLGSGSFTQKIEEEIAKADKDIKRYSKQTVPVPSPDPNLPPEDVPGLVINDWVIQTMNHIQGQMNTQARLTLEYMVNINREGHTLMVPGMLPRASNPYDVRTAYRDRYLPMLLGPFDQGAPVVGLNAGMPPTDTQIMEALQEVAKPFSQNTSVVGIGDDDARGLNGDAAARPVRGIRRARPARPTADSGAGGAGSQISASHLAPEDQLLLRKELGIELQAQLQSAARGIHIYAEPYYTPGTNSINPNQPLFVPAWVIDASGREPTFQEIYEGQIEFWTQQDIVTAIAIANRVDDPTSNVLTAPVKRLIQIEVLPGYVGLHSQGGTNRLEGSGLSGRADNSFGGPAASEPTTLLEELLYPPPQGGQIGDADQPLSASFGWGPTGRASNSLYDVRHARVDMVVDATQLPAVFEAFRQVNLITILNLRVTDVNEYQALREGRFLYGNDAVRVEMIIESIWIREWTSPLMPQNTRYYLGVDEIPAELLGGAEQEYEEYEGEE